MRFSCIYSRILPAISNGYHTGFFCFCKKQNISHSTARIHRILINSNNQLVIMLLMNQGIMELHSKEKHV